MGTTVAVKVTVLPTAEEWAEVVITVVVAALLTVCNSTADVLALKLASPGYVTVIEWTPTANADVAMAACPEPFKFTVPRITAPSIKVTDSVGTPAPGAVAETVAVRVTG